MALFKQPLRCAIAICFLEPNPKSAAKVMQELTPLYGGEKQFCLKNIAEHIQALKIVGILKDVPSEAGQAASDHKFMLCASAKERILDLQS